MQVMRYINIHQYLACNNSSFRGSNLGPETISQTYIASSHRQSLATVNVALTEH